MAWLRLGDTVAMDERVLAVAELADADERSLNEVFGFVTRLNVMAAQAGADYRVSMGTAAAMSPNYLGLLDLAARAGLLSIGEEDGRKVVQLLGDDEFMHMRTREGIAWENERKADTSNLSLIIPVRARDGDACRYCGRVVSFGMRKGDRAGTYDHLVPGQRARGIHELVVACRGCNSGRRDGEGGRGSRYPLLPSPPEEQRYYSSSTLAWFEDHGTIFTELGLMIPKRRRGTRDRRPGTQTRPGVEPVKDVDTTERVGTAATASSGEQRPTPARSASAAPQSSGEQRAASARTSVKGCDQTDGEDPAGSSEVRSADAAPQSSGEQRADRASEVRAERLPPDEFAFEVEQTRGLTCGYVSDRSLLEAEAPASRSPGTGRDGTGSGRVGDGTGRARAGPGAAGKAAPAGRRRKRGKRRRRKG